MSQFTSVIVFPKSSPRHSSDLHYPFPRYARKAKPVLAADTAEDAAKKLLETKKLSGKINYNVLENLFADTPKHNAEISADDGAGGDDANPWDPVVAERAQVTAALEKRAAQQIAAAAATKNKYSKALQEDLNKRGGAVGGGGFLGNLTFAKESRNRSGLEGLKPKGLAGLKK